MGIRASVLLSCTRLKAGLSMILKRIKSPTATSRMLSTNGIRQPQAMNCASGRLETARKIRLESMSPAGTPICGQLPKNPRFSRGECSTAIRTAPPHSPPTPRPCAKRSTTSRSGAQMPICS